MHLVLESRDAELFLRSWSPALTKNDVVGQASQFQVQNCDPTIMLIRKLALNSCCWSFAASSIRAPVWMVQDNTTFWLIVSLCMLPCVSCMDWHVYFNSPSK